MLADHNRLTSNDSKFSAESRYLLMIAEISPRPGACTQQAERWTATEEKRENLVCERTTSCNAGQIYCQSTGI